MPLLYNLLSQMAQFFGVVAMRASTSSESMFSRNIRQALIHHVFTADYNSPIRSFVRFLAESQIRFQSRSLGDAFCLFIFKKPASFIDIGAWEPVRHSESFVLEAQGWKGLLVEPNPVMAKRLREERTSLVLEAAMFSQRSSPAGAWMPHTREASDTLSATLAKKRTDIPVATTNWSSAVEMLSRVPDVVFIDIEGGELQILEDVLALEHKPKVMVIETLTDKNQIIATAVESGFKVVFPEISGYNTWFVKSEFWDESLKRFLMNTQ